MFFSLFLQEDQDPRRMSFYITYLKELAFKKLLENQSSSFQRTSSLHFLKAMNQFEWRLPSVFSQLHTMLLIQMNHPYKAVREKVAK
jgi:hypothetical protein